MIGQLAPAAAVFVLAALAFASPASATTIFADGFESGTLSGWSSVATSTGGTATVRTAPVRAGAYAAGLSETSTWGSTAYVRKSFSPALSQLTVAADLRIDAAGATGNVPLLRLFDAGGNRLVSLFRQNGDADRLYVQHSGAINATTGTLALHAWGRFELSVTVAGNLSTVVVKLDGTVIHQTTSAALGTAGVATVQLGNDVNGQPFELAADDVLVTTASSTAAPAAQLGGCDPAAPAPATSDPGTVVVADNFESGLGQWAIARTGDAQVTTQSQTVHAGGCAARIAVSASGSSLGNLTRAFPAGTREAWSDGWFDFESQGASTSWNAPTFRFFSNGNRVLDVSRQNGTASLFVRYPNGSGGWTFVQTGQYPALKRWYHVKIHVLANGNASTVEVWLDGARIFATSSATLGTSGLSVQMIGADHAGQEGVVAIDDVVVKARS